MRAALGLAAICAGLVFAGVQDKPKANPQGGLEGNLADYYGFLAPEIYKLDAQCKNLLVRDINGDGKPDIITINPQRNRIDVLQQRGPNDAKTDNTTSSEPNEIKNDGRLKHVKIPMNRPVYGLEVADVNGDGILDLVYLGDPKGLYIEYQSKDGRFSRQRTFEMPDAQQTLWALDVGDINGDGKNDIVFLGNNHIYVVYQRKDGTLEQPRKYRLSEGNPHLLKIIDFDGDGRNDVAYMTDDNQFPVRIRFQSKSGALGAERRFALDRPRAVAYGNVDGKPGHELLSISDVSERMTISTLGDKEKDENSPTSQMVFLPFEKGESASSTSDLVTGDFDGDGKTDIAVCDSDSSKIVLYRQTESEGLDSGNGYSANRGIKSLRTVDLEAKGTKGIIGLSEKEKSIVWTSFQDGRLRYPQSLPTQGDPMAMEVLGSGADTRVIYVSREREASGRDKFFLRQIKATKEGDSWKWAPANFGDKDSIAMSITGQPSDLRMIDANEDGVSDLLVFFEYQPPSVWRGEANGSFAPTSQTTLSIGDVQPPAILFEKLDGQKPSLLVAQGSLARSVKLEADGRWKVNDSINADDSNANVVGLEAVDLDGDKVPELLMYDKTAKSVLFLKKKEGQYRQTQELKVGAFSLRGMRVGDFDNDGKKDLLLFDNDKMGIAFTGRQDRELQVIGTYETDVKDGKLMDMVAGDVNGDGRPDIICVEEAQNHLEVVASLPGPKFQRAMRWMVFEEKTFRRGGFARSVEPREVVIADVTGDKRNDVIVLTHNRVLVYPQDTGVPESTKKVAGTSKTGEDR